MKKIVRQQNYLKELIASQDNKLLSKQTLQCLIRSALEPLLDAPETAVVFHRIENKTNLQGLLKRLEFSSIESISYADDSGNLLEKVWANTEFLCTLTHRYVSILIWDNNTGDKNFVKYYSVYNSKLQKEALDIIKRNSKVDISEYQEKFNPDRRDNVLLNDSLRRFISNADEMVTDAVLKFAEKSAETLSDNDYAEKKSRMIAHEIRNQLSICDLYSEIMSKGLDKGVEVDSLKASLSSINKALKMAANSLLMLKTNSSTVLDSVDLQQIVNSAFELSKVYALSKGIDFQLENPESVMVLADSEKLTAVIINLVKNATEAFQEVVDGDNNSIGNGKYIKVLVEKSEDKAMICVSNNAKGIENPDKIFDEGFSTKTHGSGLGLWICKKYIEEQSAEISLARSSEDYTEFVISFNIV
ncbi:HAMP domain-containing histidine kinase [bacterium]|nr:HAMP domain-containing histidine kinase [bacterium]